MWRGHTGERANEQAHSISLSRTLVTPTTSTPLVRDNTSRVSLLCSILRQPIWAGTHSDKFTRRSRDPQGRNADNIIMKLTQFERTKT
jgi:formylmethanofuran:tetrahydromethanopterin formyltransferase